MYRAAFRADLACVLSTLALLVVAGLPQSAQAETTVFAQQGGAAPGLAGVVFQSFDTPRINDAGQLAFTAQLSGSGVTSANNSSLWLDASLLAREGNAAAGLSGVNYSSFSGNMRLNDMGDVAFVATLTGSGVVATNDSALYVGTSLLVREGAQAPGLAAGVTVGTFGTTLDLNDSGQLAWRSNLAGSGVTTTNDTALWVDSTAIAREGSQAPGFGSGVIFPSLTNTPSINDNGETAFSVVMGGILLPLISDEILWRNDTVARQESNAAPGLGGLTLGSFVGLPSIANNGQLVWNAVVTGPGVNFDNDVALWREDTLLAREGNQAHGLATGVLFDIVDSPEHLSDTGQALYGTILRGIGVTAANDEAYWRDTTLIAREGMALPIFGEGVTIGVITNHTMNDRGLVGLVLGLDGASVTPASSSAIALTDGEQFVEVVRTGGLLEGATVTALAPGVDFVNTYGQTAYRATAGGLQTLVTYTPDLHWRRTNSGSWGTTSNWTLGLAPALVHDVIIDPGNSLTVTGPSAATTVESLTIGGGAGVATLSLFGGPLNALDGTLVMSSGVLTGDGVLDGTVINQGTVRAQNLSLSGGLTNLGLVTGNGRLFTDLENQTSGELRAAAGERLRITGSLHASGGRIDVNSAEVEFDGTLSQQSSGRLFAQNAVLRFNDALNNRGQVLVSFGTSSVFGAINNLSGGKIILSGLSETSFFDNLVNAAGAELRVSSGSVAVFFGDVSGAGSFTGTGTKFYEANFAPGASPAWVEDAGDVGFGAGSTLEMEMAGLVPGTEHDRLSVAGTLSLDGTLALALLDGYAPGLGDRFDLLDWGVLIGRFADYDLSGAALASGLAWDFERLYIDGTVGVVAAAVPLPGAWWLFAGGCGLLGYAQRGRRRAVSVLRHIGSEQRQLPAHLLAQA